MNHLHIIIMILLNQIIIVVYMIKVNLMALTVIIKLVKMQVI